MNANAVIGSAGNPNEVYLQYSNDPDWDGTGDDEPTGETPKDVGSVLKSDADDKFALIGLDAGKYKLYETKAPAGYNLLVNPIEIEKTAIITDTEDTQTLDALRIKVDGKEANGDVTTGVVETTVKNNSGATLPETVGMGTTLFYILGGVLVLAAVVLLVTKRRMNVAE